ncbi:MAG: nucleotidyl transferase AbiEii/AbiGii toxin family protein [Polaribacter sp.]
MEKWFNLAENDRKEIINQVSAKTGLLPTAIEKDWWVMIALNAIYSSEYAKHLVFKGGTSLSKSYGLIERFSEDIDLAIDRSFFKFGGNLRPKQVTKLRKVACKFIVEVFIKKLVVILTEMGVKEFTLNHVDFERSDTDPLAIELNYKSLTEKIDYLKPRILIEISSRSLRNPFENRELVSFIGDNYRELPFVDKPIMIPTVMPTRTILEKIFLLHEEFQKPKDREIRSQRMTRHLYDISKLMDTKYMEDALTDKDLYNTIVAHREMLTNISWVDYSKHAPKDINFIPPEVEIYKWKKDYMTMQESMFYGETESFENLIKKLKKLNGRINSLKL